MAKITEIQSTVNIPASRYIELLEMEIKSLKQPPTSMRLFSSCKLNDITKRIHETGQTIKHWAQANGFKPALVRNVICGHYKNKEIIAALTSDGFMEVA